MIDQSIKHTRVSSGPVPLYESKESMDFISFSVLRLCPE